MIQPWAEAPREFDFMHCRVRLGQQAAAEILRAAASFDGCGERGAARELWRRRQRRGRRSFRQAERDAVDANAAHIFSSEQGRHVLEARGKAGEPVEE
jgi:hypothetical protein